MILIVKDLKLRGSYRQFKITLTFSWEKRLMASATILRQAGVKEEKCGYNF